MTAHVKLQTPDPGPGRKPKRSPRATVVTLLSPELRAAKETFEKSGLTGLDWMECG